MRSIRWMATLFLAGAVAAGVAAGGFLMAQGGHPEGPHAPPTEGKWVRGHWTPYEPPDPEAFPEDSRIHIIVQGDTLWDLTTAYLGDPWLWPQIWDQNRYILDSHWIYPGDPILIPAPPTVVGEELPEEEPVEVAEEPTEAAPEPVAVTPILGAGEQVEKPPPRPAPALVGPELRPVADTTDLYCSSLLVEAPEDPGLIIAEREEEAKELLTDGDIVYLSQGMSENVYAGNDYQVVRPGQEVRHPATGARLGQVMHQVARVRVVAAQEHTATALVHSSCAEVLVGDWLEPFQEVPVPLTAGHPPVNRYELDPSGGRRGFIVYAQHEAGLVGGGQIVQIDLGDAEGVEPGDYLTIYRDYRRQHGFYSTESYIEPARRQQLLAPNTPYPPAVLGQLVVVRVEPHSATAKILTSFREITVGDKVVKM